MPFGSSQWMYNSGADFYNGVATQSLRFDDGSSANLTRTPSSAGNRKTWTWSGWVKRSNLGATHTLFDSRPTGEFAFGFLSGDTFYVASSSNFRITNQVFRDVSSWYHFVVVLDTTQATGSNRIKVYVNGNQITSFGTSADPSQNAEFGVNFTQLHSLGRYTSGGYFDGYMAEVNLIDGQALDPTDFGEFKNGVWIAKQYTGSYGTNGFRLQFNQTGTGSASSSTIGADTSGNANHFTSSGIVASDCDMPDSPENNFATYNGIFKNSVLGVGTLSEGNLKTVSDGGGKGHVSSLAVNTGKWYAEFNFINKGSNDYFGLYNYNNQANFGWDSFDGGPIGTTGTLTGGALSTGDIIGILMNLDDGVLKLYVNNSEEGSHNFTVGDGRWGFFFAKSSSSGADTIIANFGQDSTFAGNETAQGNKDENDIGDFYYSVPSGYLALCSANLPEPTISPNADTQADDYFNTVTYTGNGGSSTLAVTGMGFSADWLWFKNRSSANDHNVYDTNRGLSSGALLTNTNVAEDSVQRVSSIDADGFTLPATLYSYVNTSGNSYVTWGWKAGGTAVSNTDGSITSSVSANTDAGFSIVTYTGTDSATETIGHGLGAVPAMLIIKSRDSALNWAVYHKGSDATAPEDYLLRLNTTDARADVSSSWNDTAPTSSVFTVGTSSLVNNTDDFIAYCFAEIEGYSRFGKYTGNDASDGNMIFTNFSPALVIIKYTSGTAGGTKNWYMWDNTRSPQNPNDNILYSNTSDTEGADSAFDIDFLSNGFKLRNAEGGVNNGAEYIYMAFAEAPFKYANAR